MLRVITLVATLAAAGTLTGTASAHPPSLYDQYCGAAPYGGGYATAYPSYSVPSQTLATYRPTYSQPVYTPAYTPPPYDATPLYTKTYATPYYPAPRPTYGGNAAFGYGYPYTR